MNNIQDVLIAMVEILAGAGGVYAELGAGATFLDGPDFGVMEHPVSFLSQEGHVHGETLGRPTSLVAQRLLSLDVVLDSQQSSCDEIPCF